MKEKDITEAKAAANKMCDVLAEKQNVDIKVGIVTFDKIAYDLTGGLTSINNAKKTIKKIEANEDTNIMAGLIAGKAMLDNDSSVSKDSKYLVLMSDGIPIYWMENGEPTSKTYYGYRQLENGVPKVEVSRPAGSEPEGSKSLAEYDLKTMDEILGINDWNNDSDEWYQNTDTGYVFENGYKYTNIEKSMYKTAEYIANELGNYKFISVGFGIDKPDYAEGYADSVPYAYGKVFCGWLETVSDKYYAVSKPGYGGDEGDLSDAFEDIANELIYIIGEGTVTDKIGNDFDLVMAEDCPFELMVGETAYTGTKESEHYYTFGEAVNGVYPYTVTYVPGEDEQFVWAINVKVDKNDPVKLTYTVQLTEEAIKSANIDNVNTPPTNESATLTSKSSDGAINEPEDFAKPEAKYEIGILEVNHVYAEGMDDKYKTLNLPTENVTVDGPIITDWTGTTEIPYKSMFKDENITKPIAVTDGYTIKVKLTYPNNVIEVQSFDTVAAFEKYITEEANIIAETGITQITYIYDYKTSSSGGGGSTTDPDPVGPGTDEPTIDIPDPDVPLTEPEVPEDPTIDIEDPDVPLVDVPGETVEIEEPEVPLGDAPATGDRSAAIPFAVLMLIAAAGLAITRKRFN